MSLSSSFSSLRAGQTRDAFFSRRRLTKARDRCRSFSSSSPFFFDLFKSHFNHVMPLLPQILSRARFTLFVEKYERRKILVFTDLILAIIWSSKLRLIIVYFKNAVFFNDIAHFSICSAVEIYTKLCFFLSTSHSLQFSFHRAVKFNGYVHRSLNFSVRLLLFSLLLNPSH